VEKAKKDQDKLRARNRIAKIDEEKASISTETKNAVDLTILRGELNAKITKLNVDVSE